jgi:hypothetical protein
VGGVAERLSRRLTFANVVSVVALFVALGGASYAVVKAPRDSVVSSSIKKGAVKGSDLGNDRVKGADVDESSLGEVPRAAQATNADTATSAGEATTAGTAMNAQSAASADSAAVATLARAVADDSITGAKVANGSLALGDVARSHDFTFGGTVPARGCLEGNAAFAALDLRPGDIGFLVPRTDAVPAGIVFGRPAYATGTPPAMTFVTGLCNITNADISVPSTFPVRLYAFSP